MDSEDIFVDLNNFVLLPLSIGSGGFGRVFIVKEKSTDIKYAAKELDAESYKTPKAQKMLTREVTILKKLNHPAIVKFKGFSYLSFQEDKKWQPTIFTEFVENSSLYKVLNDTRRGLASHDWTETKRYICLLGIAAAMRYLHRNGILHRDLKPENILLDIDFYPKVCDFGLSRSLSDMSMTSNIGTKPYMAPEILSGEPYNLKVDVYSFAILAFEIITNELPYPDIEQFNYNMVGRIINGSLRPKFPSYVKESMKNLIERCWETEPKNRPTFDEIFESLSQNFNEYQSDLDEDDILNYLDLLEQNNSNYIPMEETNNRESDKYNLSKNLFQLLLSDREISKSMENILLRACLNENIDLVKFLITMNEIDINKKFISNC